MLHPFIVNEIESEILIIGSINEYVVWVKIGLNNAAIMDSPRKSSIFLDNFFSKRLYYQREREKEIEANKLYWRYKSDEKIVKYFCFQRKNSPDQSHSSSFHVQRNFRQES